MPSPKKSLSAHDQLMRENTRLRNDLLTIASRVSHDLRTPLGGILNSGELLKEILSEKDPSSVALTETLFTSVEELLRLIKELSFVARASAIPVQKTLLKMDEVLDGVLQELESRISKKGARITSPVGWPEVEGVPGWIAFIWWHFIMNAVQHGGLQVQIGWLPEKGANRFWISDNGAGVPAQSRAKLFQPFDSLHQPGSSRGLGLSVVQRLVELQGGECGYETNANGPRFFFTLPDAKVAS